MARDARSLTRECLHARKSRAKEGASIEDAWLSGQRASEAAHAQQMQVWGSLDDYVQAHGYFGQELTVFGERSLVSFTTDPAVAKTFGGTVIKLEVPQSLLIRQSILDATESEMLLINGWHP